MSIFDEEFDRAAGVSRAGSSTTLLHEKDDSTLLIYVSGYNWAATALFKSRTVANATFHLPDKGKLMEWYYAALHAHLHQ